MNSNFETIKNELSKIFSEYTVDKPSSVIEKGFKGMYIDVFVLREVRGPIIFRNTERTELTYTMLNGRLHVEVYSRKFKAPEKITGLKILKEYGALPDGYLYNALDSNDKLKNPVSVLYGDSVTLGSQGAQIPSRILYTWALSPQEYNCVSEERTHNALSEIGTMWEVKEGEKGFKETLFKNIYMKRGHLLQLVSFYNVSLNELIFGLGNILHTNSYGAEDSVNVRSLSNHIIAIALSKPFEIPVTPYTIINSIPGENMECENLLKNEEVENLMKSKIKEQIKGLGYARLLEDNELKNVIMKVNEIYSKRDLLEELVENLKKDAEEFVDKMILRKAQKGSRRGGDNGG